MMYILQHSLHPRLVLLNRYKHFLGRFPFLVANCYLYRCVQLSWVAYQVIPDDNFLVENQTYCVLSLSQSSRTFCTDYLNQIFGKVSDRFLPMNHLQENQLYRPVRHIWKPVSDMF